MDVAVSFVNPKLPFSDSQAAFSAASKFTIESSTGTDHTRSLGSSQLDDGISDTLVSGKRGYL
jgi:hypothetical protein